MISSKNVSFLSEVFWKSVTHYQFKLIIIGNYVSAILGNDLQITNIWVIMFAHFLLNNKKKEIKITISVFLYEDKSR